RKVQPRSRSSNRPGIFCKHRLISLAIIRLVRSINVRWQRNMTELFDVLPHTRSIMRDEAKSARSQLTTRHNLCFELAIAEQHLLARAHFPTGPHQGLPDFAVDLTSQQNLDLAG